MEAEWVIRYRGRPDFTNLDGKPWDAPRTNVMAVLQRVERGTVAVEVLRSGPGVWVWKFGQWVALSSDWAREHYITHHFGDPIVVLSGEMLPDTMWRDLKEMYEDTEALFGVPKTGFRAGLRQGERESELVEEIG